MLQKQLLEKRYDLTPKLDPKVTMTRGKPLAVGPTARLANGSTWAKLASMRPEEIKTFSLRGIKESPPYLHDGRLLTLEDTVEFFNLIFETRLDDQEKKDVVAFLRVL